MGLEDWVLSIMEKLGYLGIAFLMFLDNIFPPIPSEIIMPSAGYTASKGEFDFDWCDHCGQHWLYRCRNVVVLDWKKNSSVSTIIHLYRALWKISDVFKLLT